MRLKTKKPLYMLLTLTLVIGLIPILYNAVAQARPKLFVSPAESIFYTDETAVGATFKVNVSSADWGAPGVFGYEFKLHYDTSMLEAVADGTELPTDHWLKPTIKATNIIVVDGGTIDAAAGTVSFAASMLAPEEGKTGGGNVATIVLKITKAPPTGGNVTSLLTIGEDTFVDPTATPYPATSYDKVPGTFTYGSPPPPWFLKVEPGIVFASAIGDEITINVTLINAKAAANITGVQVTLTYPNEYLITDDSRVIEGPFLKSYGETAFGTDTERFPGRVIVFDYLLPGASGAPDGNGTIATMTFGVTALPTQLTKFSLAFVVDDPLFPTIIISLMDVLPMRTPQGGVFVAREPVEDVNADGKVNIQDLAKFAIAFGTTSTHPRWNARADVNRDERINIIDGVMIARMFGWTLP